jgi:hypothetical protein
MNPVTLVLGLFLIGTGFVTLIRRLHDRSVHEAVALLQHTGGDTGRAVTGAVTLMVPIVTSISLGLAFLAVGVMGR